MTTARASAARDAGPVNLDAARHVATLENTCHATIESRPMAPSAIEFVS